MSLEVISWDVDRVWYDDISTSICASKSTADPQPYLRHFVENLGWFGYNDVEMWCRRYNAGRQISSVDELQQCMTAFFYEMRSEVYGNVLTEEAKRRTVEGKQLLTEGMRLRELMSIASDTSYTPGLVEAIEGFNKDRSRQVAFSDGLGPFVYYHMWKLGIKCGGIVPALLSIGGKEVWFEPKSEMFDFGYAKLTGKTGKFDKTKAFAQYMKDHPLARVASIDDSDANIERILLPVHQAGGLAVGFNPRDASRKAFKEASIPVIKGNDLRSFLEIVRDPKKIAQYCE